MPGMGYYHSVPKVSMLKYVVVLVKGQVISVVYFFMQFVNNVM